MVRVMWQRAFKFRVAVNMLTCVLLFGWFGSLPRETISGFLGRMRAKSRAGEASTVWTTLAELVNLLHWTEVAHCERVAYEEKVAWDVLYPPVSSN